MEHLQRLVEVQQPPPPHSVVVALVLLLLPHPQGLEVALVHRHKLRLHLVVVVLLVVEDSVHLLLQHPLPEDLAVEVEDLDRVLELPHLEEPHPHQLPLVHQLLPPLEEVCLEVLLLQPPREVDCLVEEQLRIQVLQHHPLEVGPIRQIPLVELLEDSVQLLLPQLQHLEHPHQHLEPLVRQVPLEHPHLAQVYSGHLVQLQHLEPRQHQLQVSSVLRQGGHLEVQVGLRLLPIRLRIVQMVLPVFPCIPSQPCNRTNKSRLKN